MKRRDDIIVITDTMHPMISMVLFTPILLSIRFRGFATTVTERPNTARNIPFISPLLSGNQDECNKQGNVGDATSEAYAAVKNL